MRGWIVLVLLAAVVLFAGIGRTAITDSDEAYYAESGREMVEGGDYLTPRFNYAPRFQKPILFYWIIAAFYHLLGVTPAAARAGSALAGLGIALVVYGLGRRWFGELIGLRAGAIVATSMGTAAMARASLPDMPLAFFVTSAIASGLVPLVTRVERPRRWWILASAMTALAFLTKGPIGLVVPTIVLAPMLAVVQRQRRPSISTIALAAGVFVIVTAPWYAAMTWAHGVEYLRGFFVGDNIERFATTRFNVHRSVFYYLPIVAGGMLPWAPLAVVAAPSIGRAIRRRARPEVRVIALAIWGLAPLLLFSASVGKQPRYVLPVLPALALGLAWALEPALARERPVLQTEARLLRWGAACSAAFFVLLGISLLRARPLLVAVGVTSTAVTAAVAVALGVLVAAAAATRYWQRIVPLLAAASVVLVVAVQFGVLTLPASDPVERMAFHVATHRSPGEAVAPYQVFVRNLIFYTHAQQADLYDRDRMLAFLDSPDRVLCVMRADVADGLVKEGLTLRRLAEIRLFDPSTARPRTLLDPDPVRDLQTIVLVANR